eukprot:1158099-Pelagomonas_calceolata.AAC.13
MFRRGSAPLRERRLDAGAGAAAAAGLVATGGDMDWGPPRRRWSWEAADFDAPTLPSRVPLFWASLSPLNQLPLCAWPGVPPAAFCSQAPGLLLPVPCSGGGGSSGSSSPWLNHPPRLRCGCCCGVHPKTLPTTHPSSAAAAAAAAAALALVGLAAAQRQQQASLPWALQAAAAAAAAAPAAEHLAVVPGYHSYLHLARLSPLWRPPAAVGFPLPHSVVEPAQAAAPLPASRMHTGRPPPARSHPRCRVQRPGDCPSVAAVAGCPGWPLGWPPACTQADRQTD